MTLQTWTAMTDSLIRRYGQVPRLASEDRWKEWAAQVISLPTLAQVIPPRPDLYTDWQDWAYAFNGAVRVLGI